MRMLVLCESLALVFLVLNYILKCLEYKDLRDLFDNRGNSIKMLNEELLVKNAQIRNDSIKKGAMVRDLVSRTRKIVKQRNEIAQLKHKVYVLRKDVKHKDRAIVRYKNQNEVFKHGYHESEKRCAELLGALTVEQMTSKPFVVWYLKYKNERDAYLYCLRQIQEEVENAKKE